MNLSLEDINIVLSSLELTKFFEETLNFSQDAVKIMNYLVGDVQSELNKTKRTINQIALSPQHLAEMVNLLDEGIISTKHVKVLLPLLMESNKETVQEIVDRLDLKLINNRDQIIEFLNPIMEANSQLLTEYETRPERVTKALMGQLMKTTQGNVNPDLAMDIIIGLILKHNKKDA
jgi:aspartyl-tRNA(Asn)/glutamyl-tRNA(Gln) amidotransferase subunit B